jgi:hypothetical protein
MFVSIELLLNLGHLVVVVGPVNLIFVVLDFLLFLLSSLLLFLILLPRLVVSPLEAWL